MRLFKDLIRRYFREYFFLLTTIPVAMVFFGMVQFGFSQAPLPLSVLLALALLTVMQWVAKFEIRRTNFILKTDFQIVENWFGAPFFSWAGAKERVTSIRSWMAIFYVLVTFGISIIGVIANITMFAGLILLIVSAGLLPGTWLNQTFTIPSSVVTSASTVDVQLKLLGEARGFRVELLEFQPLDREPIISSFSSSSDIALAVVIAFILTAISFVILIQMSRPIPRYVEGLLSGSFLPQIESTLKQLSKEFNISEREIRDAMKKDSLQSELSELSKRELEILALMAQGKSNSGISKSLYITEGSVEKHISKILAKLDLPVEEDNHRRVLAVLAYLGINPKTANLND